MRNKSFILSASVVIVVTITALWLTNNAVTPKTPTWDDVVAEAKAGNYKIITTEGLAELYQKDRDGFLLVDTRQDWEYWAGHIEGAVLFSMEPTAWARWKKADELAIALGPNKNRTIVFY